MRLTDWKSRRLKRGEIMEEIGKKRLKGVYLTGIWVFVIASLIISAVPVYATHADKYEKILKPLRPGIPLAFPVTEKEIPPPPFSTPDVYPKNPSYIPGLPGFDEGTIIQNDFGIKKPKFDTIIITQSSVKDGKVTIPAGGLRYIEDSLRGEVAITGEEVLFLGIKYIYIDFTQVIEVKENVEIPLGKSVVVGNQVYRYYAFVNHMRDNFDMAIHIRTISGINWDWAGIAPATLTINEDTWYKNEFSHLYNQGKAKEVTKDKVVFEWLSGGRMDSYLFAKKKEFAGLAEKGKTIKAGSYEVKVADINEAAGTVTLQILQNGNLKATKTIGPIESMELLIENNKVRQKLIFEYEDIAGFLSPWPEPFKEGKANLKIYSGAFRFNYGEDYPFDNRYTVYPIGCATGHGFGTMIVNKEPIVLTKENNVYNGPEGYFKIVIDDVQGDKVLAWHLEDKNGAKSVTLGGPDKINIDLLVGKGRVANNILEDIGLAALENTYTYLEVAQAQAAGKPAQPPTPEKGICGPTALALIATIPPAVLRMTRKRRIDK